MSAIPVATAHPVRRRPLQGFGPMLRKELKEIVRTWRLYVVPGVLLFFALTGPVLAKLTKALAASVLTSAEGIPDPTYADSWAQWSQNLTQLASMALIITLGGAVSSERRIGTAILVFTKPVSRAAFVLAKFCATTLLVVVAAVAGMLITWGLTVVLFRDPVPDAAGLFGLTGVWLVFAAMLIAVVLALSSALSSSAAASGLGLVTYVVVLVLGLWGPARDYSPAGLSSAMSSLAAGTDTNVLWPVLTGVVVTIVALVLAVASARRVPV